jgi:AcrR family transcriptional regulator
LITRERLLQSGMTLFAERGFQETTVGDIEAAAGLQPRRGALYRHFPSKEALLEAAVQQHLVSVESGLAAMDEADPETDIAAAAIPLGRWFLAELDAERRLFQILEQDGGRLPVLRDLVRERVIDAGHRRVAALIERRAHGVRPLPDVEALAILIVGPLANHRRCEWTFGAAPLGISDERLLRAWADSLAQLVAQTRRALTSEH